MDGYLRIANWSRWQSYRKDRGQPPWIKLHRCVMRNPEWVSLSDAQRGQLVVIWLLAADHDGAIPASSSTIRKLCHMDADPDLELFASLGFIEPDANVTPERRQADANVTHQSRVEESRIGNQEPNITTSQQHFIEYVVHRLVECKDGTGTILKSSVRDWIRAFPNLDVPAVVEQACVWQEAALKWTKKGLNRAVVAWLSRESKKVLPAAPSTKRTPVVGSFDVLPEMPLSYDPSEEE